MGKIKKPSITTRNQHRKPNVDKECKCTFHSVYSVGKTVKRIHTTTSKDFSRKNLNWLIGQGFLTERNKYVCDICLRHAQNQLAVQKDVELLTDNTPDNDSIEQHVEFEYVNDSVADNGAIETQELNKNISAVIDMLNNGSISEYECHQLSTALGNYLNMSVFRDSKTMMENGLHKNFYNIQENCNNYLTERNQSLYFFLKALTAEKTNRTTRPYKLALIIEQIYAARNNKFVGPLHFSQGVVKWTLSGSKMAHTIDGVTTASGTITTLRKVLKDHAENHKNLCFTDNDLDIFSDNTQRKGKTSRVKEDGTTPVNVATNVVFIQKNPSTNFQSISQLSPTNWLNQSDDYIANIIKLDEDLNRNAFRPYRYMQVQKLIKHIEKSIKVHGQNIFDTISKLNDIKEKDPTKAICGKCDKEISKDCASCPFCKNSSQTISSRELLYGDIPHNHPNEKPSIKIGEIIGVNPNSRTTIKQVLENLCKQGKVGTERAWICLGFDGVPYRIASSLRDEILICSSCNKQIDSKHVSFETHVKNDHPNEENIKNSLYFGDILLAVGAGHMEKNLLLAVFSLCRKIFMETVAGKLGFKSKKAVEFIMNCGNHHISWQIASIVYESFAQELIYEYCIQCKKDELDPSANHFVQWCCSNVKNPNYLLIYDITFNLLLGLRCFRSGIRRNNSKFALAGRQKVAPIMFVGNHIIYRDLLINDMKIRVEAPTEVKKYIEDNESFSRSGDPNRGEGGDYITENENRHLKSHLSPGVPTLKQWVIAARNHEMLTENRKLLFDRIGMKDPGAEESSIFIFEEEILSLRVLVRKSGLLSDPYEEKPLRSLEGKELHPDLVDFLMIAQNNYKSYLTDGAAPQPIFVDAADEENFNNVDNWTISKIKTETLLLIEKFTDGERSEMFFEFSKSIANAKKKTLTEFYEEVKTDFENQIASLDDNSSEGVENDDL